MNLFNFKNKKYLNDIEEIEHKFESETKDDKTEITIYGPIGDLGWLSSTSASDVKKVLDNNTSKEIIVNLNSGGGDAFDGIAIYNQLKKHDAKIIVNIDGFAASAASVIAMAADKLVMNTGTMMMIHEASTFAWGNVKDFKAVVNALEGLNASIADLYMTRFKGERQEIETMIENETWFTVSEAIDLGLADDIREDEPRTDELETSDSEEFKSSVLARFKNKGNSNKNKPIKQSKNITSTNVLQRFKRS